MKNLKGLLWGEDFIFGLGLRREDNIYSARPAGNPMVTQVSEGGRSIGITGAEKCGEFRVAKYFQ